MMYGQNHIIFKIGKFWELSSAWHNWHTIRSKSQRATTWNRYKENFCARCTFCWPTFQTPTITLCTKQESAVLADRCSEQRCFDEASRLLGCDAVSTLFFSRLFGAPYYLNLPELRTQNNTSEDTTPQQNLCGIFKSRKVVSPLALKISVNKHSISAIKGVKAARVWSWQLTSI